MSTTLRLAIRLVLVGGATWAVAGTAAWAQAAPPQSATGTASGENAAVTELSKVEVTGTRIKQTSVATAQPVTVITAAQIQNSGFTTVGQVLQNIPQAGGYGNNLSSVRGVNTSTTINLRYLGSDRTLVLVNGKRWTPGAGGSVDLNAIPASIIDHVEILQDGASAIYGSDAISGVVNIITKKNFNGAEASAYMGMYDNNYGGVSGWDGKSQKYNFTYGRSGAKGGIVLNLQYNEQDPVWNVNRAQSRDQPAWTQENNSATANPIGVFEIQSPQLANKQFGDVTCGPSGNCSFGISGVPDNNPQLDSFSNSTVLNAFTTIEFQSPTEDQSVYAAGHYDIADNLTFSALGMFDDFWNPSVASPTPLSFGAGGRYHGFGGVPIGIGADNPYNPFGVDLVANASQYCPDGHTLGGAAVASCTPNYLMPAYSRVTYEQGLRDVFNRSETQTYRLGLSGFFDALGNEWDWDAGYSYGDVHTTMTGLNMFSPQAIGTQFDSPGFTPCNGPAQSAPGASGTWDEINGKYYQILSPGCVPMNPFGGYDLATSQGSLTPAMLQYSAGPVGQNIQSISRDYTADITGQLLQLPAGPLSVASGVEAYEQDYNFLPSANMANGNNTFVTERPDAGRITTDAEYLEINIPLLENLPLAKSLNVDLANRWSQFKWIGGEPGTAGTDTKHYTHATTGRAEFRWQPDASLLIRGSWSQAFRLPSISEFFSPSNNFFQIVQDPCAPNTQNGAWQPGTPLPPGCNGLVHSQPDNELRTGGGGNPSLQPEHAITRSVGFVYSPDWLPGFNFNADYYNIHLGNTVTTPSTQYVLDQCYLSNNPLFCSHITVAGGVIAQVNASPTNLGAERTNGVDVGASYAFPTTPIGNFSLSAQFTFVRSFVQVISAPGTAGGFRSVEMSGYAVNGSSYGIPKLRGNLGANWTDGNWSARWNVTYIGKIFESCTSKTISMNECSQPDAVNQYTGTVGKNQLGTTIYHDVSLTYQFAPLNTSFTLGVLNLFNKQYPAALTSQANSMLQGTGYRIPGRFIYARVGVKF